MWDINDCTLCLDCRECVHYNECNVPSHDNTTDDIDDVEDEINGLEE